MLIFKETIVLVLKNVQNPTFGKVNVCLAAIAFHLVCMSIYFTILQHNINTSTNNKTSFYCHVPFLSGPEAPDIRFKESHQLKLQTDEIRVILVSGY